MALAYAATSPMHSLETKDLVVAALRFADGAVDSEPDVAGEPMEVDAMGGNTRS